MARERLRFKESNYDKLILKICGLLRLIRGALMLLYIINFTLKKTIKN